MRGVLSHVDQNTRKFACNPCFTCIIAFQIVTEWLEYAPLVNRQGGPLDLLRWERNVDLAKYPSESYTTMHARVLSIVACVQWCPVRSFH